MAGQILILKLEEYHIHLAFPVAGPLSAQSQIYFLFVANLPPIVPFRPCHFHSHGGRISPSTHGPQSPVPVPQCQANKSVQSDNLSKALTQFKDRQGHPSIRQLFDLKSKSLVSNIKLLFYFKMYLGLLKK